MTPSSELVAALRHHQSGQFAAADQLYREAIAADPNDVHALHFCGVLAHQTGRNDEAVDLIGRAIALNGQVPDFHYNIGLVLWALGRRQDATTHWSRVVALNPDHAEAHMNLGNALREQGQTADALAHLRRAVELNPSPFAHNNLGLALASLGEPEAIAHYERAIAMYPDFIEPHLNLALALAAAGRGLDALARVRRSLKIKETPDNKALFVRIVATLDAVADDAELRGLVTRAAAEGWGRAEDLAPVATTLVKHGGAIGLAALAKDPLLRWLLESTVICDIDLERSLTAAREALLTLAETAPQVNDDLLRFACALARQCFINEYVYVTSDAERGRASRLKDSLLAALGSSAPVPALWPAVVAAYVPLHTLPTTDALLAHPWPAAITAVLAQQISEPREEALARASIPRLTPIENDVSRLVQAQYEENPYPRWIAVAAPKKHESVDAFLLERFPRAPFRPLGKRSDLDILVAGCGTGRHSIETARQFENANVLAVDLSATSLGYASAKTRALGVGNIEYAQADILQLSTIGRTFDVIQSSGVLHHLGDPWTGWRVLLSLLRPDGVMSLGFYSEVARRDVVAARAFIAERGFASTPDGIRACRAELMAQPDGTPRKNVAIFNDFFTTSECRDLLFHVQEHRMTLPVIGEFLAANGLTFLGFEIDFRVAQRYAARFPDDKAMTSLDNWHAFEQDNPYAFANMYCFWVQKQERGA